MAWQLLRRGAAEIGVVVHWRWCRASAGTCHGVTVKRLLTVQHRGFLRWLRSGCFQTLCETPDPPGLIIRRTGSLGDIALTPPPHMLNVRVAKGFGHCSHAHKALVRHIMKYVGSFLHILSLARRVTRGTELCPLLIENSSIVCTLLSVNTDLRFCLPRWSCKRISSRA